MTKDQYLKELKELSTRLFGKEVAETAYWKINANPKYNRHKRQKENKDV